MPKNSNSTIVRGGDFNLPGINIDNGVMNPEAANKQKCCPSRQKKGSVLSDKLQFTRAHHS